MGVPSTTATVIAFPYTADYRVNVLIAGPEYSWNKTAKPGTVVEVTYSFATGAGYLKTAGAPELLEGLTPFTAAQKAATRLSFQLIEQLTPLVFKEVIEGPDGASPVGAMRFVNNTQKDTAGYANYPGDPSDPEAGDVFMSMAGIQSDHAPGSYEFATLLHEIGHAIGLKHPGNYNGSEKPSTEPGNYLATKEDNTQISLMSYNEHPQGLQRIDFGPYDLLALNYLYGLKPQRTGDDVYRMTDDNGRRLQTLIDDGGTDTLDLSAVTTPTTISLLGGSSSSLGLVGGVGSSTENAQTNLQLAFGTEIERVIGSPQADRITGSGVANTFSGGGGNDQIDGGEGIDTVLFGAARSAFTVTLTDGAWVVRGPVTEGTDQLKNIERLRFTDAGLVLDMQASQAGGQSALLIGAVLGRDLMLAKKELMSTVVGLFDQGFGLEVLAGALTRLPIWGGVLTPTDALADRARYLLTVANRTVPTSAEVEAAAKDMEALGQGAVLAKLAASAANAQQVGLVGLQSTGLEVVYPPAG